MRKIDISYSLRFRDLADALVFMYTCDMSLAITPWEEVDGTARLRRDYAEAPYELGLFTELPK
jgi:hypothetical protein